MPIYLDNNATTQPDPLVVQAMLPYLTEFYGNPSSVHRFGQRSRQAIDHARSQIASLVHCADSELLFTGGGTEAINTAIRSLLATRAPRRKIITSTVEHSATRELCSQLAKDNLAHIVEIPVNQAGLLDLERLDSELTDDPALVTLMWANNETGVLFPVPQIAQLCTARKIPFHCDATQAIGKIPVDFHALHIDAASFASHKFHGPKGIGALFFRKGLRLKPLLIGGPQERARRGGTENVPGIVGMGQAAQIAAELLPKMSQVQLLRDELESEILARIPSSHRNGDPEHRLPNTANIGFAQLEAEAILLLLSEQDICASAGAACSSGSLEPSHVLKAMQIPEKIAHGSIRLSLSRNTTREEITQTLQTLPKIIQRLRSVLPT